MLTRIFLFVALAAAPGAAASAQTAPPAHGTMATEGAMTSFYKGLNTFVVTTIDGVEHVYHFTKNLIVHGGKEPDDPLHGLREGSTVVVHYTVNGKDAVAAEVDQLGDEGLQTTEGVIVKMDRGKKLITIRFDPGRTETFQLTDRAAAEAAAADAETTTGGRVIVYYTDDKGQKVAHYFKKKP